MKSSNNTKSAAGSGKIKHSINRIVNGQTSSNVHRSRSVPSPIISETLKRQDGEHAGQRTV